MTTKKMEARKDAIRKAMGVKSKPTMTKTEADDKITPQVDAFPGNSDKESRASRQIVLFADCASDKVLIREAAESRGISMNRMILDAVLGMIRDN